MKKIGIFYGSNTSTTQSIAKKIASQFDNADLYDVADTAPSKVGDYEVLLFGSSTWGDGEMQDDMTDFVTGVSSMDLKGKKIGLFGCGDESNEDTFCDAVGEMYERLQPTRATFIGKFNTTGYEYNESKAVKDGEAVGLLIDEVNRPELTDGRIEEWSKELKKEI